MKKLIIIQTRFTLINKNIDRAIWRVGREGDYAETIKLLLNDDRLKIRANIFFNHTLPAINRAVNNGHNIVHTILHYSDLPVWLLKLIAEARDKYDWFRPFSFAYEDECDSYAIIRDAVMQWGKLNSASEDFNFAGVRLDDDDVIGTAYFEKLAKYINPSFSGFAISFPKGIAAMWEGNKFSMYSEFYEMKIALGIAQINTFDSRNMKIGGWYYLVPGAHQTVDSRVPTILDAIGPPTYVRTFHASNDIFVARHDLERDYLARVFKNTVEFNDLNTATF